MSRVVLAVIGLLLALYVVFGLVLPALFGLLKFVLVLAVVAFAVVAVVTMVGKSGR
ncbi:hypothetical protein FHS43_000033 [Streptosporangium becharense]|uniref:Uncharacterized protein n=1 Tax=Streptosporangium becharense TaxID=1816182 RepID=A0A7W9MGT5_9ACTN|nr:hypothetical protein [Streptosporangium becharense]MBB2908787.1 hypothetical protein [Streptosporangium becharense]MBB5820195.1 hypothetical protein [Streptosporangium becharense]